MIKPTVGRVVWFWPSSNSCTAGFTGYGGQPCAATVAYVHSPRLVNLSVTDHAGHQHAVLRVPLVQELEPKPENGFYCEWMPYQKQVAAGETKPTLHAITPTAPHAAAPCTPTGEFGTVTVGSPVLDESLIKDASRFAFLTADIADRELRQRRNDLLSRMGVMTLSAVRQDIDILLADYSETKPTLHAISITGSPPPCPKCGALNGAGCRQISCPNLPPKIPAGLTFPSAPVLPDDALRPEYRPVPRLHENDIAATIVSEQFHVFEGTRVTVCCLTLRNGFAVIGQSACASGMAWNAQKGRDVALYDAKRKIWELEGYLLRERLQEIGRASWM